MPNKMFIQPIEFTNANTGAKSYGIIAYDDFICAFDNTWGSIPATDFGILKRATKCTNLDILDIVHFVMYEKTGIQIGNKYYKWEEIKDCFPPEENS